VNLADAKLLVVKIGSALVVDGAAPRTAWLESVAADVAAARARGTAVILVSSGAIALARRTLGLTQPRLRLEEKQAAAAVGQIQLAQAWAAALSSQGLTAAQLLLTLEDTEDRRRYLNARATLTTLLGMGCVPVINENDSIATAEIRFGDNDRLAARVAEMVCADRLLLLSDIDGLYTADPRTDPAAPGRACRRAPNGGAATRPAPRSTGLRAAARPRRRSGRGRRRCGLACLASGVP
jgi:glutamate 5-kinase